MAAREHWGEARGQVHADGEGPRCFDLSACTASTASQSVGMCSTSGQEQFGWLLLGVQAAGPSRVPLLEQQE